MVLNYLKIAWRNLTRHKIISLINIGGLVLGLSACILIMVYVVHELSFDRFHKNYSRIVDLSEDIKLGSNSIQFQNTSFITGPLIKQSEPDVEGYTRLFRPTGEVTVGDVNKPGSRFSEQKLIFTDSNFFSFFSFKLIEGESTTVLNDPFSLVITRQAARKYFGDGSPIGKTIKIATSDTLHLYHITGVAGDIPSNSTIQFDMLASNSSLKQMGSTAPSLTSQTIESGDFKTYLLLRKDANTDRVRSRLQLLSGKEPDKPDLKFYLTPMKDVHLSRNNTQSTAAKYFKIFPIVAGLILLLALVNYMSLTTARATLRAKEVGIRKVAGAARGNIILQFYLESALYTTPAFLLSYGFCYFTLAPFFSRLGITVSADFIFSGVMAAALIVLWLATILVAGSYPSLLLSSFKPIATLKGSASEASGGAVVRKFFTVLQFCICVALLICGMVVGKQLDFFQHADTGVNRENIIMLKIGSDFPVRRRDSKAILDHWQV